MKNGARRWNENTAATSQNTCAESPQRVAEMGTQVGSLEDQIWHQPPERKVVRTAGKIESEPPTMTNERKRWLTRIIAGKPVRVYLFCRNSKSTSKRRTKREVAIRKQIFDETRPHHGDDLIRALEYENFMRDDYAKGKQ